MHKLLLTFLFSLLLTPLFAQTAFWSEDFSNGLSSTNGTWTLDGPDSLWKHSFFGSSGEWSAGMPQPQFTSAANGFMLFDADSANYPVSPNYDGKNGSLISPSIDLSNQASAQLTWENFARSLKQDGEFLTVSVSADDGVTWTDFDVSDMLPISANAEVKSLNISPYVLGSSTVRIKFTFGNDYLSHYFWAIDDVELAPTKVHDVEIAAIHYDTSKSHLGYPVEYSMMPKLVGQPGFHPWMEVYNAGSATQANVYGEWRVENSAGSNSSNVSLSAFAPWDSTQMHLDGNLSFADNEVNWLYYEVSLDSMDENPGDNIDSTWIVYTDSVYAHDRSIQGALWNGDNGSGIFNGYEMGNVFEVFSDDFGHTGVSSISVHINETSVQGELIYGIIYRYDPDAEEWVYIDQTPDYTLQAADIGEWVTIGMQVDRLLHVGGTYFVGVGYYGGPDGVYISAAGPVKNQLTSFVLNHVDYQWYYLTTLPAVRLNVDYYTGPDLGIDDHQVLDAALKPNPANGEVQVNGTLPFQQINIYTLQGQLVANHQVNGIQCSIDVSSLPNGVYLLEAQTSKGSVAKRLVVAH